MEKFVKLSTDWPMSGIEETIWWTEYVLRHNNTEHLKGPARKTPLYQYFLLDVLASIAVLLLVVIYLFIRIVKLAWKIIYNIISVKLHRD